ncbi:MAG: DUF72 domain-containing protein [Acidimicrobiales bacterium]
MVEVPVPALRGAIRVGTSGWSYPSWVGPFYPERTSAARMLPYYAGTFTTVEAHNTHRRFPLARGLTKWTAQVPAEFRFAPKAHVGITHRRDTDGLADRVTAFYDALAPLGERLGPVLYVLPHHQPDLARLDLLLDAVRGRGAVFELAPPWWVDHVFEHLTAAGASLALVDRDGEPGPPPEPEPPGPIAYVRLRRSTYTEADLDAWAERLAAAAAPGRDVYAFVKHDESGDGPRYARGLVDRLEGV